MELVTLNDNNVPTTTSLKVAEYFDKLHANVLRDIRILVDGGVIGFDESNYLNKQNKPQPMYTMDRRAFMILTMGFTGDRALEFKQNFMDAFEAIEEAMKKRESPFEIPKTLSEALMLASKQAEQIELMTPKAEAHDVYMDTTKTSTFTEVAKSLGFRSAQQLTSRLRDDCVLWQKNTINAPNMPMAGYEEYFKVCKVPVETTRGWTTFTQTRVTPAGHEWVRQNYTPYLKVV